jgi:hypothetical protein
LRTERDRGKRMSAMLPGERRIVDRGHIMRHFGKDEIFTRLVTRG